MKNFVQLRHKKHNFNNKKKIIFHVTECGFPELNECTLGCLYFLHINNKYEINLQMNQTVTSILSRLEHR